MEEEHVYSANDLINEETPKQKPANAVNKLLTATIVFLLLVITGGGAYLLGTSRNPSDNSETTPTNSPFKAETLGEDTEVNELTVSVTPTATISGSITPGISVTPTVTPKVAYPSMKLVPSIKADMIIKLPTSTPTPVPTIKIFPIDKDIQMEVDF